jgi:hypothetical protein
MAALAEHASGTAARAAARDVVLITDLRNRMIAPGTVL